jgi:hypothetical protein
MVLAQVPVPDVGLQPAGEAAHLHVIRHHHDHVVAGLDQQHQRDAVRLGSAVGDLYVRRGRAWIHRRDQRAELEGSVGLGIAERLREQRHAFILGVGQLLDAQRMHAAFRQVPANAVLPCRLEPLHLEGLELHSEKSTSRSVDRRATWGSYGNRGVSLGAEAPGKARGARIPGVCKRRATQPGGMHRRPRWRLYSRASP